MFTHFENPPAFTCPIIIIFIECPSQRYEHVFAAERLLVPLDPESELVETSISRVNKPDSRPRVRFTTSSRTSEIKEDIISGT
jgi:hypothetical protein